MRQFDYVFNLTKFAFRENRLLYISIVISLISAAIELLAMSSLMPLFELVSGRAPMAHGVVARTIAAAGFQVTAKSLLWAFICLFGLRILTQVAAQSLSTFLGKRVLAQLCSGAFAQIVHGLSISEVSRRSVGFYISLAGDESFRASNLILALVQFVSVAALAVLYFAAILAYSPGAAGFVVAFLLCSLLVMLRILSISHRLGARQTEQSRVAGTLFLDSLNNIKAVRAFTAEKYVVGIHRALMFSYSKTLYWVDELALLMRLVPVLLLFLFFAVWLAWSGDSMERVGIAFIVTMIVYLMRFFPIVGQGVTLLMRIAADARSGRDVTEILDRQAPSRSPAQRHLGRIETVELNEISFGYQDPAGKLVLRDVSLKLARGRSYAIVGNSGLGKSTLVDILLRFYEPTAGHLSVNGVSLTEVADSDIRRRVILVGQEAAIFDDTVRNNICLGVEASMAEVQAACALACIDELIGTMPQGYATRLQYRGTNLSGGQRQRIAIARALLRKPDVLVLDEGTSALDKATQTRVVENILREFSEGIVIFVTHDPEIMHCVDEIVDLGKINSAGVPLAHSSPVTA